MRSTHSDLHADAAGVDRLHGSQRRAQAFRLDQMSLADVRPGFCRTGIRSDGAVSTVNWFEPGYKTLGFHQHPFDQLSFVLTGAMRFFVGDEIFDLVAPSVLHIPADLPHCAEPLGPNRALNVDVFAPVREDYLALCAHQQYPPPAVRASM